MGPPGLSPGSATAEITKSLHVQQMYMLFCRSSSPDSNDICLRLTNVQQKTILNNVWEVFCITDRRGSQSVGFNRQIFNKFLGTPRNRQVRKVFLRQVPMAGGGREVKGVLELSRNLL